MFYYMLCIVIVFLYSMFYFMLCIVIVFLYSMFYYMLCIVIVFLSVCKIILYTAQDCIKSFIIHLLCPVGNN